LTSADIRSAPGVRLCSEQKFSNYVNLKDYKNAILLALEMSQPGRLLSLFTSVRSNRPPASSTPTLHASAKPAADDSTSITGSLAVDMVIKNLPALDLVRLLGHVRDWNARAKTSPVAQTVLHAVLRLRTSEEIVAAFGAMKDLPAALAAGGGDRPANPRNAPAAPASIGEILDALVPYTERYFDRAERMVQESFVLDFALSEMDGGLFGNGSAAFESLALGADELDMAAAEEASSEEESEEEDAEMQ
jgi:U3 small nucleolar RNA-associated protein 13